MRTTRSDSKGTAGTNEAVIITKISPAAHPINHPGSFVLPGKGRLPSPLPAGLRECRRCSAAATAAASGAAAATLGRRFLFGRVPGADLSVRLAPPLHLVSRFPQRLQ